MDEFDRAYTLMEKADWARALAGFRRCAAKTERHAPTHGNAGICLAHLGRKADALAELERALEIDRDYEPATINLAVVARMAEGEPLGCEFFVSIDYGRECLERKRSRPHSVLGRLSRLLWRGQ